MADRFSPAQLSRRPRQPWPNGWAAAGVTQPRDTADQLKGFARNVLEPAPEQTLMLQQTLAQLWASTENLEQSIARIDREVAHWLARTPGRLA